MCTGVILTVVFTHIGYVGHMLLTSEASSSTWVHRACLCVCVFRDEAEQDVRRQALTLIYDAVLLVCVCLVCFIYIH
jgi:hypothetical protein